MSLECLVHYECLLSNWHQVGGGDSEHPFPRNVPNGGGEANPRLGRGWTDPLKTLCIAEVL